MTESPHIWTRRPKIIETRNELILPGMRLAGEYTLRSINRFSGKVVREIGPFSNLITNAGLDAVAGSMFIDGLRVGTGNIPPTFSDTGLVAQVAASTSLQSSSYALNQTADKYYRATRTYRFGAPGVSHNIQEVGAFDGDVMWSRALVVDGDGNPTSFSWGADEILDVTYTLRRYPPLTDLETTMTVNSTTYDVVCRAADAANWGWLSESNIALGATLAEGNGGSGSQVFSGAIGTIDGTPTGQMLGSSTSRSNFAYTSGNFYRDGQVIWGPTSGNGNINSFLIGYMPMSFRLPDYRFQVGIVGGGPLVKTNAQTLALNWRVTWARREI